MTKKPTPLLTIIASILTLPLLFKRAKPKPREEHHDQPTQAAEIKHQPVMLEIPVRPDLTKKVWLTDKRMMTIFTGVIVFISAVSAIVSYYQWQVFRQAIHLENAAIVNVGIVRMENTVKKAEIGKPVQITIQLINAGRTPAINVRIKSATSTLYHNLPSDFDFSYVTQEQSQAIIPPGYNYQFAVSYIITDEEGRRRSIELGHRLHIWGVVEYEDIFKCRHETEFCAFNNDNDSVVFSFCATHNAIRPLNPDDCEQNKN